MNRIDLIPGADRNARFGWHKRNYPLSEDIWDELTNSEEPFLGLFSPIATPLMFSGISFDMYAGSHE
jgi:hypothetical protein